MMGSLVRNRLARLFTILGLGMLLTASGDSIASFAGDDAAGTEKVLLAGGTFTQIPQVDVAFKNGLFKAVGLDVEVIPFPSGREGFEALIGGQVDFALMAEFPVAIGIVRNQPFALLAELSQYNGNRIIASAKAVDLKNLADLEGKKIGTTIGTNVAYFLESELASAGVKAEIINIAPQDIIAALVRGDIDAAAPFPSLYQSAKDALGKDYREFLSKNYISRLVVTVSDTFFEKKPEIVDKFIDALVKADSIVAANREAALDTVAESVGSIIPREHIVEQWQDTTFAVQLDDSLLGLVERQGAWLAVGTLKQTPPPREFYRRFFRAEPLEKALGRQ
jgi:NitT/TauT family transport system substrate-binding protein